MKGENQQRGNQAMAKISEKSEKKREKSSAKPDKAKLCIY